MERDVTASASTDGMGGIPSLADYEDAVFPQRGMLRLTENRRSFRRDVATLLLWTAAALFAVNALQLPTLGNIGIAIMLAGFLMDRR